MQVCSLVLWTKQSLCVSQFSCRRKSYLFFKKEWKKPHFPGCALLKCCNRLYNWTVDSPLCVAEGTGARSSARVSVFSDPLQQGPAGSQAWQWGNRKGERESNELRSKPREETICRMLGDISLECSCWHEERFSSCFSSHFFLKPVTGEGVGRAACQWNVRARSLGRVIDYCTMEEKEGRATQVQADQVKEERNVIGAGEGK